MTISARANAASLVAKSRRSGLLASGSAVAALVAAGAGIVSPISVQPVRAANECSSGNPTGAPATVACGGPYTKGIVYGTGQTGGTTGIIFDFENAQVTNSNISTNSSAVQIQTAKDANYLNIDIDQVAAGTAPSFTGGTAGGFKQDVTSNGFQAGTSNKDSYITFDVNQQVNDGKQGTKATFTGGTAVAVSSGAATANGVVLGTTNSNSGITINLLNVTSTGGTAVAIGAATGTANGFAASTSGGTSAVSFKAKDSSFTGGSGNGGAGVANGVTLATTGATSKVDVELTDVTIKGGTVLAVGGSANGFSVTTANTDSAVNFKLNGGSIKGGSVNALTGTSNGVNLVTTGANSDVDFSLEKGTVTGGTGISVGHGVNISTNTADSDIKFDSSENTTITATNGNGVNLVTNGGDILANGSIDGLVESKLEVGGVGLGIGFNAAAGGGGDSKVHVSTTGEVKGTAGGLFGTATGAGSVELVVDGKVSQTKDSATSIFNPAFLGLPVGIGGAASGTGNVDITASSTSTVSQVGSFVGLDIKGIGIMGLNTGSGYSKVTANGALNATGIGAIALTTGAGDATTNVGGQINVGGGKGVSPLGAIGKLLGQDEFDLTVGAAAISGAGAATVNLNGGGIGSPSVANTTPDIGGLAVVISGSKDATIHAGSLDKDGNPVFNGSAVNANQYGLFAINLGSGNAVVDLNTATKDGNKNVVNSAGTGIIALAIGGGNGNVYTKNAVVNSTDTGIVAAGVNANVQAGDVNSKDGSAVLAFALKDANVDVYGAAKGDGGILTPVAGGVTGGTYNLNIKAGASLNSNGGSTSDVAVGIVALDKINIVNDGTVNGTMDLFSLNGTHITNNSNNSWNFSGIQVIATGGDNIIDNNGTATATNSLTFLTAVGDNKLNNNAGGTFNANGLNAIVFIDGGTSEFNNAGRFHVNGVTGLFGLDDYNNSGTTDMVDDAPFDLVFTTGNFNGTDDSTLAIDAQLTPGGFADWLFVAGDVTGTTFVDVYDIDNGPGIYTGNDDAILFALVGGDTDSSNFTTNGGYDKGLFRYDVYLRDTPIEPLNFLDWNEWVLASTLDREAFEFPVIQYGAQNLWYASTGTWLDRTADLRSAFTETTAAVDLKNEGAVASMPGSVTPGIWGRVFGGTSERDMENQSLAPEGLQGPNPVFEDTFNQDYYGFMAGVDFGKEGVGANGQNTAWLFGIMGGYTGSNLDFDGSDTDVDYQQGSIGAYVTYLNGGFFADAAVKADFGNIDYSTQFGGDDSGDYTSIGVIVDTGYRYNGASGWFIEPKATLAYVNTDFDDLEVLGTGVEMSDGDSLRGRLGVRVGGTMMRDANLIEPYIEASLWNEFDGDYDAGIVSNGFNLPVNYDAGGLSGEVAAGANIINVGNGWNAFAKGAVQFGEDDLLGFSGNLGFRKNW